MTLDELKAAYKAGKRIQIRRISTPVYWLEALNPKFNWPLDCYRIHPDDVDPVPIPHPHAALMLEYAKDAAIDAQCWKNWEWRHHGLGRWVSLSGPPSWSASLQYRRKIKTITIGGIEVPAPLTSVGELKIVYIVSIANQKLYFGAYVENLTSYDIERGYAHATEENAIAHAKALIAISGGKV